MNDNLESNDDAKSVDSEDDDKELDDRIEQLEEEIWILITSHTQKIQTDDTTSPKRNKIKYGSCKLHFTNPTRNKRMLYILLLVIPNLTSS